MNKQKTYTVFFSGPSVIVRANSFFNAVVLATAERIKMRRYTPAMSVRCESTGEVKFVFRSLSVKTGSLSTKLTLLDPKA